MCVIASFLSLQTQPYLIYLNLMFNDIGPEGGELLAKALHVSIIHPKLAFYLRILTSDSLEPIESNVNMNLFQCCRNAYFYYSLVH